MKNGTQHHHRLSTALVVVALALLGAWGCGERSEANLARTHSQSGLTGRQIFAKKCVQCHAQSIAIGPPLQRVHGREAGSVPDFEYSEALRAADLRWTRENLVRLMLEPQVLAPGINMIESDLDAEGAELLVDYLETL